MKMVIISLIVLLAFIGLWVWFHFTWVEPVTSYYYEELDGLFNLIKNGQWSEAEEHMLIYSDKWQDVRGLWIYFINQNNVDDIDSSMKKLDVFVENRDGTMAQAELEHLKILFNIIKENECLSFENIM